jgi:phenylalanyl-tRNA synthetase beta chain
MKISYNWLKQFINLDWEPEKTSELLTNLGLEVEGVEKYSSIKGDLEGVIVGHIEKCEKHPNADRLKVTSVNVGKETLLKIVCGAPNVKKGQKVAVATIGTTLYNSDGESWKIKKGKIRGEVSNGMLCAEDEIGLGESHDGILILDDKLKPGDPLSNYYDIESDYIFEIGLTPNRADAMSHYGTARDIKAGLTQLGINSELMSPSVSGFHVDNRSLKIDIDVVHKKKAPRYCGITVSDVSVNNSPSWLQNRLKAIGLSPVNNVVDVTNYVLHSLGQPLHAFDADKITGQKVIVRNAIKGEKFTTLDGIERDLHCEDLMICNSKEPMCIAGVFGGLNSGVSNLTTSIFLESAYFDPVSIRKSSKRHGISTDASFRFERGVDPNITKYALKFAAMLIAEIAGGEISSDPRDEYPNKIEDKQVFINFMKANKIIGQEIPKETIKKILSSLEIKVNNVTEAGLGLTIPSYRNDVTREIDVIEEILRVYGYNNIQIKNKLNSSISNSSRITNHRIENIVADQLVSHGFFEIMTNSLTSKNYIQYGESTDENEFVKILNPLSSDLAILKNTMLFSGLESIKYNLNRQQNRLRLFEFGKTYHQTKGERKERNSLALFMTGNIDSLNWKSSKEKIDFFFTKGIVNSILNKLDIVKYKETISKSNIFEYGQNLLINETLLVEYGLINSDIIKYFSIDQNIFYVNFNWNLITDLIKDKNIKYKQIPKFPEVKRDFALLVDNNISFDSISKIAKKTDQKFLKNVVLFDVYNGKNLPKGKKSYAVSFTLQDKTKTLTEKEIDKIMSRLENSFKEELGAELR